MHHSRRSLLKTGLGLGAGASLMGALPGMGTLAAAQSGGGYKALVCILLAGGMDGHDTLIPVDPGAYGVWSDARQRLLDQYERQGDENRRRDNLIGLDVNGGPSGIGLPAHLAPLAALYRSGRLSVVSNVGPLVERTTRREIRNKTAALPPRLGSHNDQSSIWMTLETEGASEGWGWGGRMVENGAPTDTQFAAIRVTSDAAIADGQFRPAYHLGTHRVERVGGRAGNPFGSRGAARYLAEHHRAAAGQMDSLLAKDFQNAQREAVDGTDFLHDTMNGVTDGDAVVIGGNALSAQLAAVAKMIAVRSVIGEGRQIFVVRQEGYDTHRDQAKKLTGMQRRLADAMAAFYQETVRQGVAQNVLTFTVSEFGRTLTPNVHGTDHGWGGHQFVMGGSVDGGRIHGELPEIGLGHEHDMGRGRLIPTTAVEQFAGGIGRWFGVPESELDAILPTRGRFDGALAL